jgi:hypothetical protein
MRRKMAVERRCSTRCLGDDGETDRLASVKCANGCWHGGSGCGCVVQKTRSEVVVVRGRATDRHNNNGPTSK